MTAVGNVCDRIGPEIVGHSALDQRGIDSVLKELDSTPDKRVLGANAVLGVSMAVAPRRCEKLGSAASIAICSNRRRLLCCRCRCST